MLTLQKPLPHFLKYFASPKLVFTLHTSKENHALNFDTVPGRCAFKLDQIVVGAVGGEEGEAGPTEEGEAGPTEEEEAEQTGLSEAAMLLN